MPIVQLTLPVLFVVLGIAEYVHPFGPPFLRNSPLLWIIIGGLLAARHGARMAAQGRKKMLDEVPRKPLGLSDDD
jgi:hypothetical protein